MEIKWTKHALNDLRDFRAISQKSNIYKYITGLFEYSQELKDFPELGHTYRYIRKTIIKRLIYKEHSILYYIDNNIIYIISVVHHKQDINKKLYSINLMLKNKDDEKDYK